MSLSRLFNNKPIYCMKSCLQNKQNFNFSLNVKYFHSMKTLTKSRQLIVKTNISYRYLSSIRTDTTIDFKPKISDKTIDLSGDVSADTLQDIISSTDLPITALNLSANWTPISWTLHILEYLNSYLPWYATIALVTLCLRIAMFPLVIKAQRNAAKMNAILPEMQDLQQKATNARLSGNQMEFAKYTLGVQKIMKDNGVNPFKNMVVPLVQGPIFVTFFLTLRRMARFPVESLKTGGILWFVDLTVTDPYHMLPIFTAVTLWATLELGLESGVNPNSSVFIRTFMRALPVITLFFIWNFESAILMYWCSSNLISLLQVSLLKQKSIRQYLKLPAPVKHQPTDMQKKGFYESLKEGISNSKIQKKLEERKRIDEINFKKAAIGPIKKTYKTDPTIIRKQN